MDEPPTKMITLSHKCRCLYIHSWIAISLWNLIKNPIETRFHEKTRLVGWWSIVYLIPSCINLLSHQNQKRVFCIIYLLASIDCKLATRPYYIKSPKKKINVCWEKQVCIWYGIVSIVLQLSLDGSSFIILSLWHKLQWYTRYIVSIFSVDRVLGSTCFQADEFIMVWIYLHRYTTRIYLHFVENHYTWRKRLYGDDDLDIIPI